MTCDELVEQAFAQGMIQIKAEILSLARFLKQMDLRNMLEIGTESGGTFYLWCRLIAGVKISLDWPQGFSGSGRNRDESVLAARNQRMRSWAPNVHLISENSHAPGAREKVAEVLAGQSIDFLFLDGDHSYEGVKQDFETYRAFVRKDGWIVFHDINDSEYHRARGCEVARLWTEIEGQKREFNAGLEWGGIGLLQA